MGSAEADNQEGSLDGGANWLTRAGLVVLLLFFAGVAYLWLSRERIATDLIDGYLAETGLEASYDIVSVGTRSQVIANVVIGDPAAPDATIERVSVDISYGFGSAGVGAVTLDRPRLYGTYREGALSFGALDPILFSENDQSATGLPEIDITVRSGGARLGTDFGGVGAFLEGAGPLDDGFVGKLALVAQGIGVEGCAAQGASVYGDLTTAGGVPSLKGPLRLRGVACGGLEFASADIAATLSTDESFAKAQGRFDLATSALSFADSKAQGMLGRANVSVGEGALVLDHDVTISGLQNPYAQLATLRVDGAVRSGRGFSETSWNAQFEGEDIALASATDAAFGDAIAASEGTLVATLVKKLERGLEGAAKGADLRGDVTARVAGEAVSVVVPEARLRSASGETVLALSRLSWVRPGADAAPRLFGNILTGGTDLPQITGRIDQTGSAPLSARLSVAPFGEGDDRVAITRLNVRGLGAGGFAFAGLVKASGAIPGGAIDALEVPLSGTLDGAGRLRMGTACQDVSFAALKTYSLSLDARAVTICPGERGVMVAYDDTLAVEVVTQGLALSGGLAESPLNLSAKSARLSYPGGFEFADLAATIGEGDNAARMTSAIVTVEFEEALEGEFAGATATIDAVPMDIGALSGHWSYIDSVLRLSDARFSVSDRQPQGQLPRFNPLISEDAVLTLENSVISARAELLSAASGVRVTKVAIAHDLESAEGSARLDVEGLTFGPSLSLADLTPLAFGVVADTGGTIAGEGSIAWNSEDVTSTGVFRTDDLDLAAAFGPVTGLKGEVRFSDLLSLTTEPGQVIEIGSINPGIEVLSGQVRFSMTDGTTINVDDARWPFMGGELMMRPTVLEYGTDRGQRYIFEVVALDAATFVSQMELSNIGATGTFDGTVGIAFDSRGNGEIDQGLLISRQPGGSVSYVGELTYEDMGAISNYAFQSLRSLDYQQMSVGLEGDLAGEIITRFTFDGVRQGESANQDFITRRLAKLPIRFKINVRSENFYELATMVRTFWDPEALPDAIDSGVISAQDARARMQQRLSPIPAPNPPDNSPEVSGTEAIRPDERVNEPGVQPLESETLP